MKTKTEILALIGCTGILLCAAAGIYFGLKAFLNPEPWLRQPTDWLILVMFCGLLVAAGLLMIPTNGRLLLLIELMSVVIFPGVIAYQAGLVKEFFSLMWIVLSALTLGDWLLGWFTRLEEISHFERLFLGTALGFGGWMVIGTLLGVLGLITFPVAAGLVILILLLTGPRWIRQVQQGIRVISPQIIPAWKNKDLRFTALFLAVLLIFALGPFLWAITPTIRWDGISYHVAAPAIYIENHRMVEIPESAQTYWTHYAEMLYTIGMLLGGQPLPGLLHFIMGWLATGLTYCFGKRLFNKQVGIISSILFFTLPVILYEIGTPYVDAFIAVYITALLLVGSIWWQSGNDRWIGLAGLFAGLVVGIKLTGLPLTILFGLVLAVGLAKKYHWSSVVFFRLVQFGLLALLLWVPWLIRDGLWTGNPIFPNYNDLFKSPKWAEKGVFFVKDIQAANLWSWFVLPWQLTVNSVKYYHEAPGGVLMALPLLALPWNYLWRWRHLENQRFWSALIFGFAALSTLLLFNIAPNARYLIPVYPLFAVLAALNINAIWTRTQHRWLRTGLLVLAGGYLLAGQASVLVRITDFPERYPYKLIFRFQSISEYLSTYLPVYSAFQFLNNSPESDLKVLGIGVEFRLYTRAHIYGPLFSYEALKILKESGTPDELARQLNSQGFNYIILNLPEQNYRPQVYTSPALNDEFFLKYTSLEFVHEQIYVYRFDGRGIEKPPASNLLENPGFEVTTLGSSPENWQLNGPVQIIRDKNRTHSGEVVSVLHGNIPQEEYSFILQSVPVIAGQIYTVGYWATLGQGNGSLQLQINWVDGSNQPVNQSATWMPLTDNWKKFSLTAIAPDTAVSGEVVASVTGNAEAWVDDLCFAKGDFCP